MTGQDKMKKYLFLLSLTLIFAASRAHAAILYSQTANQDIYEGQSFVVDWFLDTENKSINSIDLNLIFSKNLEVTEANPGNSLVSLWLKTPTADNSSDKIELTGGIPNGVDGDKIPIFRSVFTAKSTGPAFVRLDPSSAILLNDGSGTSEELKFKNLEFNIYPKDFIPLQITSSTHPDQNQWYSSRDVTIKFNPKD